MADDEDNSGSEPATEPSLELPSLFGRRKRRTTEPTAVSAPSSTEGSAAGSMPGSAPAVDPLEATAREVTDRMRPGLWDSLPEESRREIVARVRAEQNDTPADEPAPGAPVSAAPVATAPGAPPAASRPEAPPVRTERAPRPLRGPSPVTGALTMLAGLLSGLVGVGLTALGLQGCEAVRGTSSCGGPGVLVLVVIVVAMVLVGTALLRLFRVPQPGSVSFLGVGVAVAVAVLFLLGILFDPVIVPVLPVVTAIGFASAYWVTTRYTEDG